MKVDAFLISACRSGERKAQYELYTVCYSLLMSISLRYMKSHDAAKEIVNQGFYKILMSLDAYKVSVPFDAWASRIMINVIIDDFRKNKKRLKIFENFDITLETEHFAEASFNQAELLFDANELETMITKLPDVTRKVFSLFAIDQYKHKEIAKMLNISTGTSKWHVASARKKLKTMIHNNLKTANSLNYGKSAG